MGGTDLDFKTCVRQQAKLHPSVGPQDMYKMCFQAAFGAEHMIADTQRARTYLQQEFDQTEADKRQPLMEWLCEDVARVNIAAYKATGASLEILFDLFLASAMAFGGNKDRFEVYLKQTAELVKEGVFSFTEAEWNAFCQDRQVGPVHHSAFYREAEQPAYRVIAGTELKELDRLFRNGNE